MQEKKHTIKNEEKKKKKPTELLSVDSKSPLYARFIPIKLVATFQVSLRLKCLLDHLKLLSWAPATLVTWRAGLLRVEPPCQCSEVTNSLPWAFQRVAFGLLAQHKGKGEERWGGGIIIILPLPPTPPLQAESYAPCHCVNALASRETHNAPLSPVY